MPEPTTLNVNGVQHMVRAERETLPLTREPITATPA